MDVQTKLMLICLAVLGFTLVLGVLRVTAAWYEHHVSRHDLITESKQRRYDYLKAKHALERESLDIEDDAMSSVIIDDDEPALAQAA